MEAVKMLEHFWQQLKQLGIYAQFCVSNDPHAPACREFWTWTAIIAGGVALLIVVMIAKRIVMWLLMRYHDRKYEEARAAVADPETMQEYRMSVDDPATDNLSQEEIAARIRGKLRSKDDNA
jgi:hypothetical protein